MHVCPFTQFIAKNGKFGSFRAVGGGHSIRYEQIRMELEQEGHTVTVLSPDYHNVDVWVDLDKGGFNGFPHFAWTFSNLRRLWTALLHADIVIMPENESNQWVMMLAPLTRTHTIQQFHTSVKKLFDQSGLSRPLVNFMFKISQFQFRVFSRLCTGVYTVSPKFMHELQADGIHVDGFYPPPRFEPPRERLSACERARIREKMAPGAGDNSTILLSIGRWLKEKRVERLAEVLPASCYLVVMGNGPCDFRTMHAPHKRVFVHKGMVSRADIAQYYMACDWLISASNFESFGNTSYEANLCGTPAILHPAGGHLTQVSSVKLSKNVSFVDFDESAEHARAEIQRITARAPPSPSDVRESMPPLSELSVVDVVNRCGPALPSRITFSEILIVSLLVLWNAICWVIVYVMCVSDLLKFKFQPAKYTVSDSN
eukprot:206824_1